MGRATVDPNFTQLDQMCNSLHGCRPNPSSVYKKGCNSLTKESTFLCEIKHPTNSI
jgi:hypothetical protein